MDVRVIAATNRDLEKMVADGTFRDDVYDRLAVVSIRMPPLRERADDVPLLVEHFMRKHVERLGRPQPPVDKAVYSAFNLYSWPGNIRELENVIERALVLDTDQTIGLDDLPERLRAKQQRIGNLGGPHASAVDRARVAAPAEILCPGRTTFGQPSQRRAQSGDGAVRLNGEFRRRRKRRPVCPARMLSSSCALGCSAVDT